MTKIIVGSEIKNYPIKTFSHAAVAVDVVLFRIYKKELQIVLLELQEKPFLNKWAIPGGLVVERENLEKAAKRHLENKIGLHQDVYVEQLYSFGNPDRDPLGWVVSISYIALTNKTDIVLTAHKRYKNLNWFSVKKLPNLAYDHKTIIETAIKRLMSKIEYTNIVKFLINDQFTMTELQNAYEVLLGKSLDKRNFRKKILSLKIIKPTQKFQKDGQQRPARLYVFKSPLLEEYSIL